jgi:hypothetical protein
VTFKQGGTFSTSDGITLDGMFQIVWQQVVSQQITASCTQSTSVTLSH